MSTLVITHLNHDLAAKKSYANLVWSDDPNRRLGVEVPYQTAPADVEREVRRAVDALSAELAAAALQLP